MKDAKCFLKLFYVHRFFKDFILLYPVYMLLFESKGLSVADMSWLLIIWSVPVFLLELPSGVLADRWNRKHIIVAGTAFKLAGFALWWLAEDFWLFATGFALWGVQEAFCSGSTEALLFDTLKDNGRDADYEKYAGRAGFFGGMGVALSMLIGGFAASAGYGLPALLSVASVAVSLLAACFLKGTGPVKTRGHAWRQSIDILKEGFLQCRGNTAVTRLLLFGSLVAVVPGILEEYDQLYVYGIGFPLGMVGVWGGFRTGVEAMGSYFASFLKKVFDSFNHICLLAVAGAVLLFLSVYFGAIFLLPAYALFYALTSGGCVLAEGMMQRETGSEHRATVLSFNSLLMNLSGFLFFFLFAGASEFGGLRTGFLAMAVYMAAAAAVLACISAIRTKGKSAQ